MEENSENRLRLGRIVFGLLFFFTFVYPFLLENIRMFENVASYNVVRVIPLPKAVRYGEIIFFISLSLFVYFRRKRASAGFVTWKEITPLFASMVVGLFVALVAPGFDKTDFALRLQVLWLLLSGYVIFYIFYHVRIDSWVITWALRTLFAFGFVNALVGIVQMYAWGFLGDDVNGAMQDAHTFANVMLMIMVLLMVIKEARTYTPVMILPFIAFVGASSQKSYVVLIGIALMYFIFFTDWKTRMIVGISAIAFGSTIFAFVINEDPEILDRYSYFFELGVKNTGIARSYTDIVDIHNQYIFSYPFGIGDGNYANPVNYPSLLGEISVPVSQLFNEKISSDGKLFGAFDMQVTFFSFVFVEFGLVGGFLLYRFYGRVLKKLFELHGTTRDSLSLAVGLGLMIPLIASFFTLLYSMEQITIMYPLLALAGILCQRNSGRKV